MQPFIDVIKANITEFAKLLGEKGLKLSVGAVTFRDVIEAKFAATSDIPSFITFIQGQSAAQGEDLPEAGLLAIKDVIDTIKANGNPEEIQAIIAITDALSHNGAAAPRNCSLESIANDFNADINLQPMLKLYYSVSLGVAPCSGYNSPKSQYDALFDKILPTVAKAKRGGALPWPFSANVFLNDFVNQIDSIVVSEELVCLPKSAVLNADSETLATWKPASYEAMYEAHEKKDKIEWAEAVPAYKLNAAKDKDITLTVTQCCQKKDKAKDGSFDSCHKETSAKVKYEIK